MTKVEKVPAPPTRCPTCVVHCEVGAFGGWTSCSQSCGTGVQQHTRPVVVWPTNGGGACPSTCDSKSDTCTSKRTCNGHKCPINCVHQWGAWGTCTKSCGVGAGTQTRSARVSIRHNHGGVKCPADESRTCNSHACPVNCVVNAWQSYSTCTKSCGGGSQRRVRTMNQPQFGGAACPHETETRPCNKHACAVDCVVGTWAAYNTCDKSCGTGAQSRVRINDAQPKFGGKACPSIHHTRSCNMHNCPVDCVPGSFDTWSTCTTSCANGSQKRSRVIAQPFCGGKACPHTAETQGCSHGPCAIHCTVSAFAAWFTCTKSCGTGVQSRSRAVTTRADHGGYVCPYLQETRRCNSAACATNCVTSAFSAWSACTKPCGGGSQVRIRTQTQPTFGGEACAAAHLTETQACNVPICHTPVPTPAPNAKSAGEARLTAKKPAGTTQCSHVKCEVKCHTHYNPIIGSPVAKPNCSTYMYDWHTPVSYAVNGGPGAAGEGAGGSPETNGDNHHCFSDPASHACLCFCGHGMGASYLTHNALNPSVTHPSMTRTIAGYN